MKEIQLASGWGQARWRGHVSQRLEVGKPGVDFGNMSLEHRVGINHTRPGTLDEEWILFVTERQSLWMFDKCRFLGPAG